jgi:hypothetical protein
MDFLLSSTPSHCDILCGKTSTNQHPGNVFFRQLILAKVDDYMLSTKKAQKGLITAEILDELDKKGARFMKFNKKTKQWFAISSAAAREKVSHAIRDRVLQRKKGKIVLPNLPLSSSTPIASTTINGGKRTSAPTRRFKKLRKVEPAVVSKTKTRSIKVVQGGDCIVTLTATLQESSHLVSEDEDCSCSSDNSASMTSLGHAPADKQGRESYACGFYVDSYGIATPAPTLSYCMNSGDCDFLVDAHDRGLLSTFDGIDYAVSVDDEDDSSFFLDEYNDLMVNDFANNSHDEDPHRIMCMLQEAWSIMMED